MTTFVIPEEAKEEIVKRKMAGATWSALSRWVEDRWGVAVHRTTLQKWYDREVELLDEQQAEDMEDMETDFTPEAHVKLAKKVETYKAESRYWKKVAEAAIKKDAKENLLIDSIKKFTPSYKEVKKYKRRKPTGKIKGNSTQSMIAPLTDTHIGQSRR